MHQEQPKTLFLFRYDSTSGLWVETMLDSPVSRALLEAMNAILRKDGILAYIGTRSEFGLFRTELDDRREADSKGYWTSLPEHTLISTLGLYQNPSTAGGRSLVFYGSPRTLMLGYMIDMTEHNLGTGVLTSVSNLIERHQPFLLGQRAFKQLGVHPDIEVYPHELQDSMADFVSWLDSQVGRKFKNQVDIDPQFI
jgi:hypothetical protein